MTHEEKIQLIAKAIDVDASRLTPGIVLENLEEWDSLAIIGTVAMLDKHFDIQLKANEIAALKTLEDILAHTSNVDSL